MLLRFGRILDAHVRQQMGWKSAQVNTDDVISVRKGHFASTHLKWLQSSRYVEGKVGHYVLLMLSSPKIS